MEDQQNNPSSPHVLAWIGVGIFVIIIGGFWLLGLSNVFEKTSQDESVVSDLYQQWDKISNDSKQTIEMIEAQTKQLQETIEAQEKKPVDTTTIKQQLQALLSEQATAQDLSETSTSTPTTSTP